MFGEHGIGKHGIGEYRIGEHGTGEYGIGKYGIGEILRTYLFCVQVVAALIGLHNECENEISSCLSNYERTSYI